MKKNNFVFLLAPLLGAFLVCAFAPFHAAWLSFIIPGLLWWLLESQRRQPRATQRMICVAWLFHCAFFAVGVSWVEVSIHQYGGASIGLAFFLTTLFILTLSLYGVLFGFLCAKTRRIFFPAIWMLCEYLRAHLFTGFPWLLLAFSQTNTQFGRLAPYCDELILSFLIVAMSCALIWLIDNRSLVARTRKGIVAFGVLLLCLYVPLPEATPVAQEQIGVAVIQGNIAQSIKWDEGHLLANLNQYRRLLAAAEPSDLALWPEGAVPFAYPAHQNWVENTLARSAQPALLYSAPLSIDNHRFYNSIFLVQKKSDGSFDWQMQAKEQLVPFGEYVPFERYLRGLIDFFNLPMSQFIRPANQTTQPLILERDDGKHVAIAALLCYEIAYQALVNRRAAGADVLITLSDDSWFGNSIGPWQHLQIAQFRALQKQLPLIRVTNTGISAAFDARGKRRHILPRNEALTALWPDIATSSLRF